MSKKNRKKYLCHKNDRYSPKLRNERKGQYKGYLTRHMVWTHRTDDIQQRQGAITDLDTESKGAICSRNVKDRLNWRHPADGDFQQWRDTDIGTVHKLQWY